MGTADYVNRCATAIFIQAPHDLCFVPQVLPLQNSKLCGITLVHIHYSLFPALK